MRRLIVLIVVALLAACAHRPPPPSPVPLFRLAPATLGTTLALAQRLQVVSLPNGAQMSGDPEPSERSLDGELQIDGTQLKLAAFAFNQRVLLLNWDGTDLHVERHAMLPAAVDADRILRDIQLCYWPLDVLRNALPAGWTLEDNGLQRRLLLNGELQVQIDYRSMPRWSGVVELDNRREGYRLRIESAPIEATP